MKFSMKGHERGDLLLQVTVKEKKTQTFGVQKNYCIFLKKRHGNKLDSTYV